MDPELVAEAVMLILAMVTVGQQFVCVDDFDFSGPEYSAEFLTASVLGVGAGGFAAFMAGGKLLEKEVSFAGDATGGDSATAGKLRESKMAAKSWNEMDAADREARDFALNQPGYVAKAAETQEERLARANAMWSEGNDEFAGYGEKSPRAGADLILLALAIVQILNSMTGLGPPYVGEEIKAAANQFTALAEQLGSAFPGDRWRGGGFSSLCQPERRSSRAPSNDGRPRSPIFSCGARPGGLGQPDSFGFRDTDWSGFGGIPA